MRLEWAEPAVASLEAIHDYIAQDQPFYAERFIDRLMVSAELLMDFPEIGRRVYEAGQKDVREIIFQGYRIIYRVHPDVIRVITVLHGSRNLTVLQPKPWEVG